VLGSLKTRLDEVDKAQFIMHSQCLAACHDCPAPKTKFEVTIKAREKDHAFHRLVQNVKGLDLHSSTAAC
jgi:hypothetical protein